MKQLASKTTGISLVTRTQKWQAAIKIGDKNKHLGTFDTKEEAAVAYDAAVDMYFAPGKRKNYIEVPDAPPGARYIPTTQGYFALIDEDDYERVSEWKWSVRISRGRTTYICRSDKSRIPLHQFIAGFKAPDHIDGDPLNNRKGNLRRATTEENGHNVPKHPIVCTSKYKGICWNGRVWMVSISVNKKQRTFGYYSDEKQAALAYNEAAKVIYKEFAWLNEVDAEITEETLAKVNNRLKGLNICGLNP